MNTRLGVCILLIGIFALAADLAFAQPCEEARKMLEWATNRPPEAMTEEMFRSALEKCPDKTDYYRRIAEYYKHWYETELNADLQSDYRSKAIVYYEKAIADAKGKTRSDLRADLAALQQQDSFSKLAMRRLRPSAPGASGTGISLQVYFELDSYTLDNQAQEHLDILGEYMVENRTTRISLEGHTDRHGERSYNLDLSQKRAESAKAYLVENYSVQSERILTMGHGYDHLADPTQPYDSANRRVEVIKIKE